MCRRAQLGVLVIALALILSSRGLLAAMNPVASVHLTEGWATFGQVVPQGLAFDGLQVGNLPTQTDVKNRWPDGSIRFAVVTAKALVEGNYDITTGLLNTGSVAQVPQTASVALTISGCTPVPTSCPTGLYTASLPAAEAAVWLSGPLVREARSIVRPAAVGGELHPYLRVNFDTRVYRDGTSRVDVSVENMLNSPEARTLAYDVEVTVPGATPFAKPNVEHPYLTRWRKVFSTATFATIVPDISPFNLARALPPYLLIVADAVSDMTSPATSVNYNILGPGALEPNMPAHSGRQELAPYPDWTARYLVHKNPTQRNFVLANGDLSGSWPVHVREAEPGIPGADQSGVGPERIVSLDQRPTFWYDERGASLGLDHVRGAPLPIREYGNTAPMAGSGQSRLIPDNAHQPSIAYVPYLMTGDLYYAEEMAFWANYGMLRVNPDGGTRGSNGILESQETRGYAWALRNLVDAAAYYPDASPVKGYLSAKVNANLAWLDDYATAVAQDPNNPLKILWLGYRGSQDAGFIALWEQNYLAFAIDRANKQGFNGGLVHRDTIARLQLALFSSEPDYPRSTVLAADTTFSDGTFVPAGTQLDWGAPYLVNVATVPDPDRSWENPTYFTTMAQVAAGTTQGPTRFDRWRPYPGYYGPEARLNLMIGVESGWAGAQGAYDYLFPFIGINAAACGNLGSGADRPDLACRAGWALDFHQPNTPPPADLDADGDGVNDAADAFPLNPGESLDTDGDGVGNSADLDDDNDGTPDNADAFPLNASENTDTDGDGIGNNADPDDDNDARLDGVDPRPLVPNQPPTVASPGPQSSVEGAAISPVQVLAADMDGDAISYSASALPTGLAIDPQSGAINGTPGAGAPEMNDVTVTVSDGLAAASVTFAWAINNTGSGTNVVVTEPGWSIVFSNVTAPGNTRVTPVTAPSDVPTGFSVDGLPAFDVTTTAQFSGPVTVCIDVTPLAPDADTFASLRLLHGEGGTLVDRTILEPDMPAPDFASLMICTRIESFSLIAVAAIIPANEPPTIASPGSQSSAEGASVSLPIAVSDPDGDAVTLVAAGLPPGMALNGLAITGTPPFEAAGSYQVTLTASDGTLDTVMTFEWTVTDTNRAPSVSALAPPQATADTPIAPVAIIASDPDGDVLAYSATALPPGLSVLPGTNTIAGIPTQPGTFSVTARASDGKAAGTFTFNWVVVEAPAGAIELGNPGPQTSREGDWVRLRMDFEADGSGGAARARQRRRLPIHFTASGLPRGVHIHQNGIISGRVADHTAGEHRATVTLRIGKQEVTQVFTWTILPRNRPPRLRHLDDQASTVGTAVKLLVRATDPDGDPLTFTAKGLPPGLSMSAGGVISGTVGGGDREYHATVTVSDGQGRESCTFHWKAKVVKAKKEKEKGKAK